MRRYYALLLCAVGKLRLVKALGMASLCWRSRLPLG
jgi:hypothetical protein